MLSLKTRSAMWLFSFFWFGCWMTVKSKTGDVFKLINKSCKIYIPYLIVHLLSEVQGWVKSRGGDKGGSSVNLGCFLKYLSQKRKNIAPVYWVFKSNCLLWSSILFCLSLSFFEWRSFVPLSNLFEWSFSPSIRIYAPCRQRKGACENTKSNWLYPCRFSHPSDSIPFKDICLIRGITFYFVSWFTWLLLLYDSSFSFWWLHYTSATVLVFLFHV